MTNYEAKQKLKAIAGAEYHRIRFDQTECRPGETTNECSLYIHGYGHCSGATWEEAFEALEMEMMPKPAEAQPAATHPEDVITPWDMPVRLAA